MSARASHARLRRSPVLPGQVAGAWESGRAPPTWLRRPEKEETKVQRAYGRGPPLHKGGLKMRSSTTGNCGPDDAFLQEKSGRPWVTTLVLYGCSVLGVPVFLPGQSGGAGALELPARRGGTDNEVSPSSNSHFLPCRKAPAWESASARWYFERGFLALPVPSRKYRSFAEGRAENQTDTKDAEIRSEDELECGEREEEVASVSDERGEDGLLFWDLRDPLKREELGFKTGQSKEAVAAMARHEARVTGLVKLEYFWRETKRGAQARKNRELGIKEELEDNADEDETEGRELPPLLQLHVGNLTFATEEAAERKAAAARKAEGEKVEKPSKPTMTPEQKKRAATNREKAILRKAAQRQRQANKERGEGKESTEETPTDDEKLLSGVENIADGRRAEDRRYVACTVHAKEAKWRVEVSESGQCSHCERNVLADWTTFRCGVENCTFCVCGPCVVKTGEMGMDAPQLSQADVDSLEKCTLEVGTKVALMRVEKERGNAGEEVRTATVANAPSTDELRRTRSATCTLWVEIKTPNGDVAVEQVNTDDCKTWPKPRPGIKAISVLGGEQDCEKDGEGGFEGIHDGEVTNWSRQNAEDRNDIETTSTEASLAQNEEGEKIRVEADLGKAARETEKVKETRERTRVKGDDMDLEESDQGPDDEAPKEEIDLTNTAEQTSNLTRTNAGTTTAGALEGEASTALQGLLATATEPMDAAWRLWAAVEGPRATAARGAASDTNEEHLPTKFGKGIDFEPFDFFKRFMTLGTAVRNELGAASTEMLAELASKVISEMLEKGSKLWPQHQRYVCMTDASCSAMPSKWKMTEREMTELGLQFGKGPIWQKCQTKSIELARTLRKESEDMRKRSETVSTTDGMVYFWIFYDKRGWTFDKGNSATIPKKARYDATPRWKLAKGSMRRGAFEWSEIAHRNTYVKTGRADLQPSDIEDAELATVKLSDLALTTECGMTGPSYYKHPWSQFKDRFLFCWAQDQATPTDDPTIKDLIMPSLQDMTGDALHETLDVAVQFIQTRLENLPSMEQSSVLTDVQIRAADLKKLMDINTQRDSTPGRTVVEAAMVLNAMQCENNLPEICDPMAPRTGTQLACPCLFAKTHSERRELCVKFNNEMGLHGPFYSTTKLNEKWDFKRRPKDEVPGSACSCTCGVKFPNALLRKGHLDTTRDATKMHGVTSDELACTGGAFMWLDTHQGKVLDAKSFRLATRSREEAFSTAGEAETVTQAALAFDELARSGRVDIESAKTDGVEIYTDSKGTVDAIHSQVLSEMKATKRTKSGLKSLCLDHRRVHEFVEEIWGLTLCVKHIHNEHNRLWSNTRRDALPCRGNKACDYAADAGAKRRWREADARGHPQWRHGGKTTLACNGMVVDEDIAKVLREKMGAILTKYLTSAPQQGRAARGVRRGEVHVEATKTAWNKKHLSDDELECVLRGMLGRNPNTMKELYLAAKADDSERILERLLRDCGATNRELCPYCFDTSTGKGFRDSRYHSRYECQAPTSIAAREAMEAVQAERIARLGPAFSIYSRFGVGANVREPFGDLAEACFRDKETPDQDKGASEMEGAEGEVASEKEGAEEVEVASEKEGIEEEAHAKNPTTWFQGLTRESMKAAEIVDPQETRESDESAKLRRLPLRNGKELIATEARLRSLYVHWKGDSTRDFDSDAAELLTHVLQQKLDAFRQPAAAIAPALLMWINRCLEVEQEYLTDPLAATSGIFLEKSTEEKQRGVETTTKLKSVTPTLLPGSMPQDSKGKWNMTEENAADPAWTNKAWARSGVIAMAARADGDTTLLKQVIEKCLATAESGHRVVLLAEMPTSAKKGKQDKPVSFANTRGKDVSITKLMDIPAGRITWATATTKDQDEGTVMQMHAEEGGMHTARGRGAEAANEGFIGMWLFAPKDDQKAGVVSGDQLRELARVLSQIANPMPKAGDAKDIMWRGKQSLALREFANTEQLDAHEGRKILRETQTSEEGKSTDKANELDNDEIYPLPDGIARQAVVDFYQRGKDGRPSTKAADAQNIAAELAAGEAHDCERFFETMMAIRASSFCRNVGTKIGSMNTPHGGAAKMVCGCCNARVTAGWFIPVGHENPKAKGAIQRIQRRRARRIKDQEFLMMDQSFKGGHEDEEEELRSDEEAEELLHEDETRLCEELPTTQPGAKGKALETQPEAKGNELKRPTSNRKRNRPEKFRADEAPANKSKYGNKTQEELVDEAGARGIRQQRRGREGAVQLLELDNIEQAKKDKYRPREVCYKIDRTVEKHSIAACMDCARPLFLALDPQKSDEGAKEARENKLWREVCSIAQGDQTYNRTNINQIHKVHPKSWVHKTIDILERDDDRKKLIGKTVSWGEGLDTKQQGTVVFIEERTKVLGLSQKEALVHIVLKAQGADSDEEARHSAKMIQLEFTKARKAVLEYTAELKAKYAAENAQRDAKEKKKERSEEKRGGTTVEKGAVNHGSREEMESAEASKQTPGPTIDRAEMQERRTHGSDAGAGETKGDGGEMEKQRERQKEEDEDCNNDTGKETYEDSETPIGTSEAYHANPNVAGPVLSSAAIEELAAHFRRGGARQEAVSESCKEFINKCNEMVDNGPATGHFKYCDLSCHYHTLLECVIYSL